MTIRLLADVSREALSGLFICTPSGQTDLIHGWPARIEKATTARIAYRRLPRGAWDAEQGEWQVAIVSADEGDELRCDERVEQCLAASVQFVCDTAEEAVTLYVSAMHTQKSIASFRKASMAALTAQAQAGALVAPTYLTPNRA